MKFSQEGLTSFFNKTKESSFGEPVKMVERLAELIPAGSVLDIGAGDGRNALYLAEKGFAVTAIDLSEAGIAKLQRTAHERGLHVVTEVADAATYTIKTDYDAFVVVLLFQFLAEEDSLRLMKEMKEHTKTGGINVVHVFTTSGDRERLDREEDPGSSCFYPADDWLKKIYSDWEIVEHSSASGPLIGKFNKDGSPMTSVVERILARKSDTGTGIRNEKARHDDPNNQYRGNLAIRP